MKKYIVLLRGINVGGKNKISMADLRAYLEELGYSDVLTYIASGNVVLKSEEDKTTIKNKIEKTLPEHFKLDSELIKILVLTSDQLKTIVRMKPRGFGEEPEKYHCDVIFLMESKVSEAMSVFDPREGVDKIWEGKEVIYSQRLSAQRTKSRLNRIMGTLAYKNMTIRNWNTVTALLDISNN